MQTHKEVSRLDIREIVNDKEWQELRKSFLGTWKFTPAENISHLESYLGDFSCPFKLRRVHNYLTGSAFRIGVISHPEIDKLLSRIRTIRYTPSGQGRQPD